MKKTRIWVTLAIVFGIGLALIPSWLGHINCDNYGCHESLTATTIAAGITSVILVLTINIGRNDD